MRFVIVVLLLAALGWWYSKQDHSASKRPASKGGSAQSVRELVPDQSQVGPGFSP